MANSLLGDKQQRVITVDDTDYTARNNGTITVRIARAKDDSEVGTLTPSTEVAAAAGNAASAKTSVDKAAEQAGKLETAPEEVLPSIDQQLVDATASLEESQTKPRTWYGTDSKVVKEAQDALSTTRAKTKEFTQQLKDADDKDAFLKSFNEEYLPNLLQDLAAVKEKTDKAAKVTDDIKGLNYTGTTLSDGNKCKVRGGADVVGATLSDAFIKEFIEKDPEVIYDAVFAAAGTKYIELTKEDGTTIAYVDSSTGSIVTPEDIKRKVGSVSKEEPGPGSMDVGATSAYTHRQVLGLNDILAAVCADFIVKDIKDIPLKNTPPGTQTTGRVMSATIDDTEYVITDASESVLDLVDPAIRNDLHRGYALKHVFKKNSTSTEYTFVGTLLLIHKAISRSDFLVPKGIERAEDLSGYDNTVVFFIPWSNGAPTKKTTQVKITISTEEHPKGELVEVTGYPEIVPKFRLSTSTSNKGYWDISLYGSDNTIGAFTSLLGIKEKFEDCEKRTDALYRKNNQQKDSTTAREVKATNTSSTTSTSSNTTTTTNTSASVATKSTWSFQTASTSFGSSSSSSSADTSTFGTSASTNWGWEANVNLSASANASSSSSSSSSSGSSFTDKVKSAFDSTEKFIGKVASFFTKDTKTARGEDLKEDEPLSVPDLSEDMQKSVAIANAPNATIREGARDAILYCSAINRQKIAYGKGRTEYQAEHQNAEESRKNRLAAKQANIKYKLKSGVDDSSNWA